MGTLYPTRESLSLHSFRCDSGSGECWRWKDKGVWGLRPNLGGEGLAREASSGFPLINILIVSKQLILFHFDLEQNGNIHNKYNRYIWRFLHTLYQRTSFIISLFRTQRYVYNSCSFGLLKLRTRWDSYTVTFLLLSMKIDKTNPNSLVFRPSSDKFVYFKFVRFVKLFVFWSKFW